MCFIKWRARRNGTLRPEWFLLKAPEQRTNAALLAAMVRSPTYPNLPPASQATFGRFVQIKTLVPLPGALGCENSAPWKCQIVWLIERNPANWKDTDLRRFSILRVSLRVQ